MLLFAYFLSILTGAVLPFDGHSNSLSDISILKSDYESFEFNIVLNGIEMIESNGAYSITIPDWGTDASLGTPDIPSYTSLLAVPGEDLAEVEVEFSNPVQYSIRITPATENVNDGNLSDSYVIDNTRIEGVEASASLDEYGYPPVSG